MLKNLKIDKNVKTPICVKWEKYAQRKEGKNLA